MRKSIWIHIVGMMLSAVLLCACGKDDLHYLETTAATEASNSEDVSFHYTPREGGEPYSGNMKSISVPIQYHDGYLYLELGGGVNMLVRYNCETGNVTAVCPDPICEHTNADCPLFDMRPGNCYVIGEDGNIYFDSLTWIDSQPNYALLQFDAQSGKTQVMADYGDTFARSNEFFTEDYCFTLGGYWDEARENYTNCVMRYDLNTLVGKPLFEIDQEMAEDYSYTYNILFIVGDRLYLSDQTCVFSVNFDGGDRKVHFEGRGNWLSRTDGTYMYYCNTEGELCRRTLTDGTEEHLGVYPSSFLLTDDYICYRTGESVTLGKAIIRGYASDTVTLEAGEIRVCNLDGTNDRLVYRFEGDTAGIRPVHGIAAGNYYYCTYLWWDDPDGDGIYRDGANKYSWATNGKTDCDLLRIDLTTGELYRIHIE